MGVGGLSGAAPGSVRPVGSGLGLGWSLSLKAQMY
jgi:hypothetical protein